VGGGVCCVFFLLQHWLLVQCLWMPVMVGILLAME
jgi:hypothetical protein